MSSSLRSLCDFLRVSLFAKANSSPGIRPGCLAVPKAISESICHLAKFDFQLLKLGMHKCVQLRRKFESAPRKGRSLSRETRECAYKQFELALLLYCKTNLEKFI